MNLKRKKSKSIVSITIFTSMVFSLILVFILSCSEDSGDSNPPQSQKGEVKGTVKDEDSNTYPGTLVKLSKGTEEIEMDTDSQGSFKIETKNVGAYEITLIPPLSSTLVTSVPMTINVEANQAATVDLVIKPQPVVAHMNFGNVDIFDEINDEDGNTPTDADEPIYAANIFDAPLGLLTAIKAPDGHHVTLSEWQKAKGNLMVNCNGNTSTVKITLEGLIPNGTYTFWLAYLNKIKKVGESINGATDFIFPTNPPLGSGTKNVLIAGADGTINASIEHASCILTEQVALVMPILYHINGKTFGSGHVPDEEETVHMLVYFQ